MLEEKNSHLMKANIFQEEEKRKRQEKDSKSLQSGEDVIDLELRNTVLTHILANYTNKTNTPLLLGISGNPGEGKTYQTLKICKQKEINTFYFSMMELNNVNDNRFLSELELDYKRACSFYYTTTPPQRVPCVIVIDDICFNTKLTGDSFTAVAGDTPMASAKNSETADAVDNLTEIEKDTAYSSEKDVKAALEKNGAESDNRIQLLTGVLMKLCMQAESRTNFRVPIILIGDSLEYLYDVLRRETRMDFYRWKQSEEVKAKIICSIFYGITEPDEKREFKAFVENHMDKPISWFVGLKYELEKKKIQGYVKTHINKPFLENIDDCDKLPLEPVKVSELEALAILNI